MTRPIDEIQAELAEAQRLEADRLREQEQANRAARAIAERKRRELLQEGEDLQAAIRQLQRKIAHRCARLEQIPGALEALEAAPPA